MSGLCQKRTPQPSSTTKKGRALGPPSYALGGEAHLVNLSICRQRQRHVVNGFRPISPASARHALTRLGLAADAHDHVAGFDAPLGRGPLGSTPVTTTPS